MAKNTFKNDLAGVQKELFRFACKLTSNGEDAKDLLQETSLKALDNEDKYSLGTNFRAWMYTIMRNLFINNYRKVVSNRTYPDHTDNLYHLNLPQDSGFESTESTYDLKEMYGILNTLPKEFKTPFSMYLAGFKYREIAEKLALPLGTIKSRIFSARQELQRELQDFV
jgi:RNA polymerase sigma-70 factor (ECF subfamily)